MSSFRPFLTLTALLVFIADFVTKWMAIQYLKPNPMYRYQVIPGFFDLLWAENTGGAFSVLHGSTWLVTGFSLVALGVILAWALSSDSRLVIAQVSFGAIIGGAFGNLLDRFRFQYVVDFLHFYFVSNGKEYYWPTFNVADMGICGGLCVIVYLTLFTRLLDGNPKLDSSQEPGEEQMGPNNNS